MEVLVLKAFMANGKVQPAGTVIDLPVADAAYVIGLKRAEYIEPAAETAEAMPPAPKRARKAKAE
jgi:hypothetical protein